MVYVKVVNDKLIAGGRIGCIRGMSPGFATISSPQTTSQLASLSEFFFRPRRLFSPFSPKAEPNPRRAPFPLALLTVAPSHCQIRSY